MKLGIVLDEQSISQHFGQANGLAIYEINDQVVTMVNHIQSIEHQHEGMPQIVLHAHIDVIICGNLGQKAIQMFKENNIEVISGIQGELEDVLRRYQNHELVSNNVACSGHEHEHEHEHNHGNHHN